MLSPPLDAHMRAGSCSDQATLRKREPESLWASLSCFPLASSRALSTIRFFLFATEAVACLSRVHSWDRQDINLSLLALAPSQAFSTADLGCSMADSVVGSKHVQIVLFC